MKKRTCLIFQVLLLAWFFLDMTGLRLGGKDLVTQAYAEDGIFFVIYLISLLLFIYKEKIGKWVITVVVSMWFVLQFLSHEWYTIFGGGAVGASKIRFFSETIHWLDIEGRYIPDVYHTVLHILILSALIVTIRYIAKSKGRR